MTTRIVFFIIMVIACLCILIDSNYSPDQLRLYALFNLFFAGYACFVLWGRNNAGLVCFNAFAALAINPFYFWFNNRDYYDLMIIIAVVVYIIDIVAFGKILYTECKNKLKANRPAEKIQKNTPANNAIPEVVSTLDFFKAIIDKLKPETITDKTTIKTPVNLVNDELSITDSEDTPSIADDISNNQELVMIAQFDNKPQALLVRMVLEKEAIESWISGEFNIMVHQNNAQKAKDILKDIYS